MERPNPLPPWDFAVLAQDLSTGNDPVQHRERPYGVCIWYQNRSLISKLGICMVCLQIPNFYMLIMRIFWKDRYLLGMFFLFVLIFAFVQTWCKLF
jgi:hypothetical protein